MERKFTDLEGLRIAVEMERRGAELYRHGAKITTRPEAAQLLNRLERDESQHQATFAQRYEARRAEASAAASLDGVESEAYLSAVAAEIVFPEGLVGMALEDALSSPANVLKAAIKAEEDSIRFYEEMAAHALKTDERGVFARIAREEREHLDELRQMLTMEETP